MDMSERVTFLEKCDLFGGLGEKLLVTLASLATFQSCPAGETLFRQGEICGYLYALREGQVFLERDLDLGHRKGCLVVATLGPGRVFGCWSTLLGETHRLMCSAVCQRPTEVLVFKGEDLRSLMLTDEGLGFKVLERLCLLLRERIEGAYGAFERI